MPLFLKEKMRQQFLSPEVVSVVSGKYSDYLLAVSLIKSVSMNSFVKNWS